MIVSRLHRRLRGSIRTLARRIDDLPFRGPLRVSEWSPRLRPRRSGQRARNAVFTPPPPKRRQSERWENSSQVAKPLQPIPLWNPRRESPHETLDTGHSTNRGKALIERGPSPVPVALLLAVLATGFSRVNAGSSSNEYGERVVRIGVTSRDGTRRVIFVRQGNRVDRRPARTHSSGNHHQTRIVVPRQSETPRTLTPERGGNSVPSAATGASPSPWASFSNIEQVKWEATVSGFSDVAPVQTRGRDVPQFVVPPTLAHPPRSSREAAEDTQLRWIGPCRAVRTGPLPDVEHTDRPETSRGLGDLPVRWRHPRPVCRRLPPPP